MVTEDSCEVDSDSSDEFGLVGPAFGKKVELELCLFLQEGVLIFIVDQGGGERDGLVERDFLVEGSGFSRFSDGLLVVGFPLDVEERGELDGGVGLKD